MNLQSSQETSLMKKMRTRKEVKKYLSDNLSDLAKEYIEKNYNDFVLFVKKRVKDECD